MRISTFFYTLKQGFINIFRNKWFSLASVATISACLFLFGLFFTVIVNFQHMIRTAEEGVSVTVFFEDGVTQEQMEQIGEQIRQRDEVAKADFISADEPGRNGRRRTSGRTIRRSIRKTPWKGWITTRFT